MVTRKKNVNEPPAFIPQDDEKQDVYELPNGRPAFDLYRREKTESDFVIPGFIAGTVGALIAPGSTGKSMLAMQLAALISGADTLGTGWQVPIGDVVVMAIEDPETELFNRWSDLGSRLDQNARECGRRVQVIPMLGQSFNIMIDSHYKAVAKACFKKRLLILDTLRRIHTLDENDGGQMAQVIGRLESIAKLTGCAILFLHHTGKSASLNGQGDLQQASRGSSVLVDNIRFQMFMVGMTAEDDEAKQVQPDLYSRFVRMGVSKVNYGAKPKDVWLHRSDGGILEPAQFATSSVTMPQQFTSQKPKKEAWI